MQGFLSTELGFFRFIKEIRLKKYNLTKVHKGVFYLSSYHFFLGGGGARVLIFLLLVYPAIFTWIVILLFYLQTWSFCLFYSKFLSRLCFPFKFNPSPPKNQMIAPLTLTWKEIFKNNLVSDFFIFNVIHISNRCDIFTQYSKPIIIFFGYNNYKLKWSQIFIMLTTWNCSISNTLAQKKET